MNFSSTKQRANQILTAVGLRKKGFYSPYNYTALAKWNVAPYPAIERQFMPLCRQFVAFIDRIAEHAPQIAAMRDTPGDPHWNTRWLSPLDMAAIYTFIATQRPKRIIEVGCGVTTHTMARAIAENDTQTDLTCIDPEPRIRIDSCAVTFLKRPFSQKDVDLCAELNAGDVLFIDSSHFMQQGYDVDMMFNRAFFELKPGVIVHIHDIFLPYGYPDDWQRYRFNEQQALIGWLANGFFETLFASHFVWRTMADKLEQKCPGLDLTCPENGGSIWLRKA